MLIGQFIFQPEVRLQKKKKNHINPKYEIALESLYHHYKWLKGVSWSTSLIHNYALGTKVSLALKDEHDPMEVIFSIPLSPSNSKSSQKIDSISAKSADSVPRVVIPTLPLSNHETLGRKWD